MVFSDHNKQRIKKEATRERNKQAKQHTNQTINQTNKQLNKQAKRHTNQTSKQSNKQTIKQMRKHIKQQNNKHETKGKKHRHIGQQSSLVAVFWFCEVLKFSSLRTKHDGFRCFVLLRNLAYQCCLFMFLHFATCMINYFPGN